MQSKWLSNSQSEHNKILNIPTFAEFIYNQTMGTKKARENDIPAAAPAPALQR